MPVGGIRLLANALNPGIPEPWELEFGILLEETGRKTGLLGYCITLDFWKNSFYSSILKLQCLAITASFRW